VEQSNFTELKGRLINMGLISNGTTLLDAGAIDSGIAQGPMQLITTLTASSSANLSFTSGISSTYKEYVFKYLNLHAATDEAELNVNFSIDGGSNYNVAKTSSFFRAEHTGGGTESTAFEYRTGDELSNGTGTQKILRTFSTENDHSGSGTLTLYDPSNTTFVKHFTARGNVIQHANDTASAAFVGGYANTTSAINAVQFTFSSGNIDAGIIKMYGVL